MDLLKWCLARGPEQSTAMLDSASDLVLMAVDGPDSEEVVRLVVAALKAIRELRDHILAQVPDDA